MAIFLGGCSLFVAYREIHRYLRIRHKDESIPWGKRVRLWGIKRFLASVVIILVYIFLLGKLPFLVASVGLILTLGTVFREGRFLDALRPSVIAALVIVVIALVISKVFGISFP
jgi:ABC-type Fe3+ transport system permease subunit